MHSLIVQRALYPKDVLLGDMGIDHSSLKVLVAEELLDRSNVISLFQEVRCKAMSEGVDGCLFRNSDFHNGILKRLLKRGWMRIVAAHNVGIGVYRKPLGWKMKITGIIYVKVYVDRFRVKLLDEHQEIETMPKRPFTSQRLLVADFLAAAECLQQGIKTIYGNRFVKPVVVIHPLEKIEGGLSEVEKRVLKDLAEAAGARIVYIWVGPELSDSEIHHKIENKSFV